MALNSCNRSSAKIATEYWPPDSAPNRPPESGHALPADYQEVHCRKRPSMIPENLKQSAAYYRLTFADADLTIPGVQPMIYVGINIFPDDDPTSVVHYFQDTVSHSWRGPVTDAAHDSKHPEIESCVFPHTADEVQRDILTLDEVVAALTRALERTVALERRDGT